MPPLFDATGGFDDAIGFPNEKLGLFIDCCSVLITVLLLLLSLAGAPKLNGRTEDDAEKFELLLLSF